jgi:hypothetical protein
LGYFCVPAFKYWGILSLLPPDAHFGPKFEVAGILDGDVSQGQIQHSLDAGTQK